MHLLNLVQRKNVKNLLVQERERLFNLLKGIPFLKPFPSHSNFILCEVTSGKDAKKIKVRFLYCCIFMWFKVRKYQNMVFYKWISLFTFSGIQMQECLQEYAIYNITHMFYWKKNSGRPCKDGSDDPPLWQEGTERVYPYLSWETWAHWCINERPACASIVSFYKPSH